MKAKWKNFTKEELIEIALHSSSNRDFLIKLGYSGNGGAMTTAMNSIKETYPDIDFSHFTGQCWNKGKTKSEDSRISSKEKYALDDIFIENSPITQKVLRGYVERYSILEYKCAKCNCDGSWQGGKIALEIHHINGDKKDNRVENLQYLCPNCHALTENYRGKNIGRNVSVAEQVDA